MNEKMQLESAKWLDQSEQADRKPVNPRRSAYWRPIGIVVATILFVSLILIQCGVRSPSDAKKHWDRLISTSSEYISSLKKAFGAQKEYYETMAEQIK